MVTLLFCALFLLVYKGSLKLRSKKSATFVARPTAMQAQCFIVSSLSMILQTWYMVRNLGEVTLVQRLRCSQDVAPFWQEGS